MSSAKEPEYRIVTAKDAIEVRDYTLLILAEVAVAGERKEAINKGFKILADYIFGNNSSNKKIAMTAPVIQQQEMDHWKVRFVMPKEYSFEMLPKPNSNEVLLISKKDRRFAVICFSGLANDESIMQHTNELNTYILTEKLNPIGTPILAFYNPPWTLPFLRRNEVMIEIDHEVEVSS